MKKAEWTVMTGLDSGFFVELLKGNDQAVAKWKNIVDGETDAAVCSLTIYELKRLTLKGGLTVAAVQLTIEAILAVCQVVWIDNCEVLDDAARLSHGNDIPTVDAIILASLLQAGVRTIYSTDRHLQSFKKKGVSIINLLA
ncbi:MAG TPA: PIN domain-containing protein [Patescibacteria group bacterium]|nr:PIN domain-containing protein [Patescibacteria group bacterium]